MGVPLIMCKTCRQPCPGRSRRYFYLLGVRSTKGIVFLKHLAMTYTCLEYNTNSTKIETDRRLCITCRLHVVNPCLNGIDINTIAILWLIHATLDEAVASITVCFRCTIHCTYLKCSSRVAALCTNRYKLSLICKII